MALRRPLPNAIRGVLRYMVQIARRSFACTFPYEFERRAAYDFNARKTVMHSQHTTPITVANIINIAPNETAYSTPPAAASRVRGTVLAASHTTELAARFGRRPLLGLPASPALHATPALASKGRLIR